MKTNSEVFQSQIWKITFFSNGPCGQQVIPQMPLMGSLHGTAVLCCHVHTTAGHDTRAGQILCSASTGSSSFSVPPEVGIFSQERHISDFKAASVNVTNSLPTCKLELIH